MRKTGLGHLGEQPPASSIARPDTPVMSAATKDCSMLASSSSFSSSCTSWLRVITVVYYLLLDDALNVMLVNAHDARGSGSAGCSPPAGPRERRS